MFVSELSSEASDRLADPWRGFCGNGSQLERYCESGARRNASAACCTRDGSRVYAIRKFSRSLRRTRVLVPPTNCDCSERIRRDSQGPPEGRIRQLTSSSSKLLIPLHVPARRSFVAPEQRRSCCVKARIKSCYGCRFCTSHESHMKKVLAGDSNGCGLLSASIFSRTVRICKKGSSVECSIS